MSIVTTLILVQQNITRYILPTMLALGNLGNFITIGMFSQKKYQTNSCSIYLLAVSLFSFIGVNWAIVPLVYALDHPDPVSSSLILCRIRGYIIHTCSMGDRSLRRTTLRRVHFVAIISSHDHFVA
ncbi:unnamed protein product [Rotaria sordida]|uniref:G-protein coupled receptors family 1 profile domain-containing protein n=1 Tax=Rotaria sordida TaxID=392033 RepID=A0A819M277_9BILA|nr:unnamed protein product [Rotaria sordida]